MEALTFLILILIMLLIRYFSSSIAMDSVLLFGMVFTGIEILTTGLYLGTTVLLNPYGPGEYSTLLAFILLVFGSLINLISNYIG